MTTIYKVKQLLEKVNTDYSKSIKIILEVCDDDQGVGYALRFLNQSDQSDILITTCQNLLNQDRNNSSLKKASPNDQITVIRSFLSKIVDCGRTDLPFHEIRYIDTSKQAQAQRTNDAAICGDLLVLLNTLYVRASVFALKFIQKCNQQNPLIIVIQELLEREKTKNSANNNYGLYDVSQLLSRVTSQGDVAKCKQAKILLDTRDEKTIDTALTLLKQCNQFNMFIAISIELLKAKQNQFQGQSQPQIKTSDVLLKNAILLLDNIATDRNNKNNNICKQVKDVLEVCGVSQIPDAFTNLSKCDQNDVVLFNAIELLKEAQKAPAPVRVEPDYHNPNRGGYSYGNSDHDYAGHRLDDDHAYRNSDHEYN